MSKLQGYYCGHCWATTKVGTGRAGIVILLNTQAAELTQDCMESIMGHNERFDW